MKSAAIAVLISLSLSSLKVLAAGQSANFDAAYSGNVTQLFDQSAVTGREEFSSAPEPEKQKMLLDEFATRKDNQYFEILKSYFWVAAPIVATVGMYKLYKMRFGQAAVANPGAALGGGAAAGVGIMGLIAATLLQPVSYIIINPIKDEIERFTSTLSHYFSSKVRRISAYFSSEVTGPHFADELEKMEHRWVVTKRNITAALWAPIEAAIAKARNTQSSTGGPLRKQVDVPLLIQRAINLPNHVKELDFDPDLIAKEFRGYDLDSPDALLEFCFRFVAASRNGSPISKIPLYFEGPAGVGKSEAGRKLARVLDASIGEVSLEEVTHVNDLLGWPKDHEKAGPGLIVEAMLRANKDGLASKNMLLVFDEADATINQIKSLIPALKKLLEPKTRTFYNAYFEADIEIIHVGFIFIGNSSIKDEALRNRMQPVGFKGFLAGYKSEVIREIYIPQLLRDDFSHPDFGDPLVLSESDTDFIEKMVKSDKDPGFRTIFLNVRRYLEHKALAKQFNGKLAEFKPIEAVK